MPKMAIQGGRPAVTTPPPNWPMAGDLEAAWMEAVVRDGKWSWMGPHEQAFCREFASFIGSKKALCMANGTVTIQCALQAVGVEPDDEVIVPGLTWVATAQAAMDIGANVVFVDIDPETWCISPRAIEKAITPRTKAIVVVHLYSCMCDMDAIMKIARERGLKVIEDTAHQAGSRWRNRGAGSIGDAGSFSFQQSKVLTCGEGGAVTCNTEQIYHQAFSLKHVGFGPDLNTPGGVYGHNYRMTEMQAMLLRGGLSRLAEHTARREESVSRLRDGLARLGGPLRVVRRDPRVTRQAYYCLSFHFDPAQAGGLTRKMYAAALNAEGIRIATGIYAPVYRHPLLMLYHRTSPIPYRDPAKVQNYAQLTLPVVERVVNQTALVMPHPHLLGDETYIDQLLEGIKKVNGNLVSIKRHFQEHPLPAEPAKKAQHAPAMEKKA